MNQNTPASAFTRRRLIQIGGATVAAAALPGCSFLSTAPTSSGDQDQQAGGLKGQQAPDLAKQVEAGELPPLPERLPKTPVVITPVEQIGQYGGKWRTALLGPADAAWLDQLFSEPMVRWNPNMNELLPNVAESFEADATGAKYTFKLREGMRWSDGEPFTADDVVFAQNDVYNNEEISVVGDTVVTATKVDELTVALTLSQPNSLWLESGLGSGLVTKPKHYLEKFHKKYNPKINDLVKKEGAADWVELFGRKGGGIEGTPYNALWQNPELPRLHAWGPATVLGEGGSTKFVRNPYYWKTDTEGNQLPYIDAIEFSIIQDEEVMLLKAQNGQFDMHFRHFNTSQNKPVLADGREKGKYRFFDTSPEIMNNALIIFNLSHKNAVRREIFNNLDFRIGLSYALNREEIIQVAHQRQGEPWQAAPRPESPFYDESFAKQYTEFDLAKANEHLDKAGYKQDGQGRRIGPDGKPIAFNMAFAAGSVAKPSDTLELVRKHWQEVGIDARLQPQERSLLASQNESNDSDVYAWEGDGGLNPTQVPDWYFPDPAYLTFARGWSIWSEEPKGEDAMEPPGPIKRQFELYDQVQATTDRAKQVELTKEILKIAKDNFWVMGTVLTPASYGIAGERFRNIPEPVDPAQPFYQIDVCQSYFSS